MHDNQQTFEARDVVRFYAASKELQAPEKSIFEALAVELAGARLLDVGIGGGRTTRHLAKKVKSYVGVDYAAGMIAECTQSFPALDLRVADVREMKDFEDASFDVVLFSFNGIDYIDHAGRVRALGELRRVTKPGGAFVFSTHNLLRLPDLFTLPLARAWNPAEVVKHLRLRMNNAPLATLMAEDHANVNDGSYAFRSTTYYVRPRAQLDQLASAGFADVRTFALTTGKELAPSARDAATDPWLYFLCR